MKKNNKYSSIVLVLIFIYSSHFFIVNEVIYYKEKNDF
jgi:hypothetical protein